MNEIKIQYPHTSIWMIKYIIFLKSINININRHVIKHVQ